MEILVQLLPAAGLGFVGLVVYACFGNLFGSSNRSGDQITRTETTTNIEETNVGVSDGIAATGSAQIQTGGVSAASGGVVNIAQSDAALGVAERSAQAAAGAAGQAAAAAGKIADAAGAAQAGGQKTGIGVLVIVGLIVSFLSWLIFGKGR